VKKKEVTYITVAQKGGKKKLNVDKICYVEVRDHDLIYHSTEGDIVTKSSMKEAEDMLGGTKFFRCNRCYLVNLEYVKDFRGNDVTVASDVIQVSRARKKAFMDALNDYMNEVGR
jgi:DNA-binding LytR/AlgR family response regulator